MPKRIYKEKVSSQQVLRFAKEYHERYHEVPKGIVMANFFNVSPRTIYTKLNVLEKMKLIKRIKRKHHKTAFQIC